MPCHRGRGRGRGSSASTSTAASLKPGPHRTRQRCSWRSRRLAPPEAVLTGRNGPGRARTIANRVGTALTGAVRTGRQSSSHQCPVLLSPPLQSSCRRPCRPPVSAPAVAVTAGRPGVTGHCALPVKFLCPLCAAARHTAHCTHHPLAGIPPHPTPPHPTPPRSVRSGSDAGSYMTPIRPAAPTRSLPRETRFEPRHAPRGSLREKMTN